MNRICLGGMLLFGLNAAVAGAEYFTQYEKDTFRKKDDTSSALSVVVTPERSGAIYRCGETAVMKIAVTGLDEGVAAVDIQREARGVEQFERRFTDGAFTVDITSEIPEFVTCAVTVENNGVKTSKAATVGFSPEEIVPAQVEPDDFMNFWTSAIAAAGRDIPLDAKLVKIDRLSDELADTYSINFANINSTRMYGYICVPKKPGKYPAFFAIPGAGSGFTDVPAEFPRGKAIAMVVNVHDFEIEPATAEQRYAELNRDGIYIIKGMESREKYYYYRTIIGLARGVAYLAGRDEWDGKHLLIWGSSQGGAMALATCALNADKVTAAALNVPAMCDFAGWKVGRRPVWPTQLYLAKQFDETLQYYDGVNFARHIECPVICGVGLMDVTCPPASVFAMYNILKTPKSMWVSPWMGHDFDPEYSKFRVDWVREHLLDEK
ncbi:MAG: acetylxylan esterase [Victivallaceae bacterium]|nr:acetylxylan esterase [Victivallaceae bacterium]